MYPSFKTLTFILTQFFFLLCLQDTNILNSNTIFRKITLGYEHYFQVHQWFQWCFHINITWIYLILLSNTNNHCFNMTVVILRFLRCLPCIYYVDQGIKNVFTNFYNKYNTNRKCVCSNTDLFIGRYYKKIRSH